jgi:hypothetical protein
MAFVPPVIDFNFKISGDQEIARRFAMAGSSVKGAVRSTLKYLAQTVAIRAQSRVPRKTGKLATRIGYRFTMGRSGISKDQGDRVVIRSDIGARGFEKAKSYAIEMGQLGRRKEVSAHNRIQGGRGWRLASYKYTHTSVIGSTIKSRRFLGMRTMGGVAVKAYTRRFANKANPFLGPAAEESRSEIEQALMVALPRRLARIMQTGEAAP